MTCHAIGCESAPLKPEWEWCAPHWRMIPPDLQKRLLHTTGSEHRRARDDARVFVEQREFGGRLL